jgi:PPOX class probable F420-dependent enzyme
MSTPLILHGGADVCLVFDCESTHQQRHTVRVMTEPLLDLSRPEDSHIEDRLRHEPIAWLGTTSPAGRPHHVPVWFLWNDPVVYVFSGAGAAKVNHIRRNRAVSLSLDSAAFGTDIVIVEGDAELIDDPSVTGTMPAFVAKYGSAMSMPAETWAAMFPQAIGITAAKAIGWTKGEDGLRYRSVGARMTSRPS